MLKKIALLLKRHSVILIANNIKAYLEFLDYVLTLFMRFNKRFKISMNELLLECIRFLRILGAKVQHSRNGKSL